MIWISQYDPKSKNIGGYYPLYPIYPLIFFLY